MLFIGPREYICNCCSEQFKITFRDWLIFSPRVYPTVGIVCEFCWHSLKEADDLAWEMNRLKRAKRTKCQICRQNWSFKIMRNKYICQECFSFFIETHENKNYDQSD